MNAYLQARNYVSEYIYRTHDLNRSTLNKALYYTIRTKFGLKSQMAKSVLKTVAARYKTILANQKEWILFETPMEALAYIYQHERAAEVRAFAEDRKPADAEN